MIVKKPLSKESVEKALAVLGVGLPAYNEVTNAWCSAHTDSPHHGWSPLTVDAILDLAMARGVKINIGTDIRENRQPDESAFLFSAAIGFHHPVSPDTPLLVIGESSNKLIAIIGCIIGQLELIESIKRGEI